MNNRIGNQLWHLLGTKFAEPSQYQVVKVLAAVILACYAIMEAISLHF